METNSTSEGIEQSFHVTQCPDLEEISKRSLFFVASLVLLSVVNGVLLFVAVFGNAVILWVLRGVSSIHPPSRTLFYSLAASDICVGLIVQPFNLIYMISTAKGKAALCSSALPYWDVIGFAMSGISLLTTSEISVDRLLALRLKFRYREVVSLGRTRLVVVMTWLLSFAAGSASLWNRETFNILQIIGLFLSIAVSSFSYTAIHLILHQREKRRQERQIAWDQPSKSVTEASTPASSTRRYKSTVSTALWVYCVLLVCSLPYMIVAALWAVYGGSDAILISHAYAITLLYFNSVLNPILYCWKISQVRQAVREFFSRVWCK